MFYLLVPPPAFDIKCEGTRLGKCKKLDGKFEIREDMVLVGYIGFQICTFLWVS